MYSTTAILRKAIDHVLHVQDAISVHSLDDLDDLLGFGPQDEFWTFRSVVC